MSSKAFSPSSISIKEAATQLGVHESTVRRYADRGVIRATRLPSGVRRLSRADVAALVPMGESLPAPESAPSNQESVDEVIERVGAQPVSDLSTLARPGLWDDDEDLERFLALNRELRDRDG